jgi:hypothetical protein
MELPQDNLKCRETRFRICEIEIAVGEAIDKICEDHNYQIEYSEINHAIVNILNRNLGYENFPKKED